MAAFTCNTFSIPRHRSPSPILPAAAAPSLRCHHHHHLLTPFLQKLNTSKINHSFHFTPLQEPSYGNNNNDNNNNRGGGGGGGRGDGWNDDFFNFNQYPFFLLPFYLKFEKQYDPFFAAVQEHIYLFLISASASISYFILSSSEAQAKTIKDEGTVCEIRGGKKIELVPDYTKDEFIVPKTIWFWDWGSKGENLNFEDVWMKCRELVLGLMLPEGFPESVTGDYLEYSLWRGVQGIASQISGVLATQSLLYAVGLGKGAIPTAAAVNWVLKDGIGYLSKILLSKYGRHFDVHPKGWRLFADLLENAAYGMEILTPAFPHLFVPIGAVAGAGRSAAALIQAATRSCFYAGFAAQRNFAEVIAKGEAQGMVSKSIGITLGIGLASCVQSSVPLALASFGVVTWIHMFCNLKSYQSIQLRTLNPYRASLVFSEYLVSGLVPSVKEVNAEEPLFPAFSNLNLKPSSEGHAEALSEDAKDAAANIGLRLQLGSKLSEVVRSREDTVALFDLYKNEGYILTELEGRYHVVLKESSSPQDMLKSLFQVNYLYWLERNAGIKSSSPRDDCRPGGSLQISLDYVVREFNHVKNDGEFAGWTVDGLIARSLPNRISIGNEASSPPALH